MATAMNTCALVLLIVITWMFPSVSSGDAISMETLTLEGIVAIYNDLVCDNLAHVQTSGADGVVTNVYPVYMAGYLHSTSAIPILLERLEWEGANEPIQYYHRPSTTLPSGLPAIRIGMVSLYPRPPTPSVGALTQIPVPWETLQSELMMANPTSRRAQLLAWVASVRHPSDLQSWLNSAYQANPGQWGELAVYASTNLVGRKPFSMDFYMNCPGFCFWEARFRYDRNVSELRRRVAEEESASGTGALPALFSALHVMGQPDHAPTPTEVLESVELVSEEENGDISDLIEVEPE